MMVEMLNELFADSSSIYFYFSIFFSGMGMFKLTQFGLHKFIGNTHVSIRKSHAVQIQSAPIQNSIGEATDIMNWIVRKAKRIESPDDDNADAHTISFFLNDDKKRGGQRWGENLYSLTQKNIA
ncbi:hypothetical protein ACDX78_08415 [Virgibacillus oceani]